jgi:hypothetical protein
MVERAPYEADGREVSRRADSSPRRTQSPRTAGPSPAGALALQRAIGNRATGRILSRWAAHPDKDKKGQFMSDAMAASWDKFNPPLSK